MTKVKIKMAVIITLCFLNSGVGIGQCLYNTIVPSSRKEQGYIVTKENDTLHGTIITGSRGNLHRKIKFLYDGMESTYEANQLLSFHFGDFHFVSTLQEDILPNGKHYFIQQLNEGFVKFYRFYVKEFKWPAGSPIPVVHANDYHLIKRGNAKINGMDAFRRLSLYAKDNAEIDSIIAVGKINLNHIPNLFNKYNKWLVETGKIEYYQEKERMYEDITEDIYQAEQKGLLSFNDDDVQNMDYIFRMIKYAQNTDGYGGYIIYDHRDDYLNTTVSGLVISADKVMFKKIGEWKYYYPARDKKSKSVLKKEEYYNARGKLHGEVKIYNTDGSLKEIKKYDDGKKIK